MVGVKDVQVGERFRLLDESYARELAEQIAARGRMFQPIGISSDGHLVWGRHRLRAAEILAWEEIAAQVLPYRIDDVQARLDELDENLQRKEFTALELARALARRKVLYESLHPETRRGAKGGRKPADKPGKKPGKKPAELTDTVSVSSEEVPVKSFAAAAAEKTGKSERTIARSVQIGQGLPPEIAAKVAQTPVGNQPRELLKLAKLVKQDPQLADTVADMLREGEVQSVTEALAESELPPEPAVEASAVLREMLAKLKRAWQASCGKAATPSLGAAVLEAVAEQWLNETWTDRGGKTRSQS